MPRRKAALHRIEHPFLVQVDQHPALHRIPEPGALDLAWLEHDVAIGQHHRRPQRVQVRDGFQDPRVEPLCEGIFQQECRHLQQVRILVQARAEYLQRTEVIGVAQLVTQRSVDRAIARALRGAEVALQARVEIDAEAVVVEQRVVDIQQEYRIARVRHQHGVFASGRGSCQPCPSLTMSCAVAGPQLPGS